MRTILVLTQHVNTRARIHSPALDLTNAIHSQSGTSFMSIALKERIIISIDISKPANADRATLFKDVK